MKTLVILQYNNNTKNYKIRKEKSLYLPGLQEYVHSLPTLTPLVHFVKPLVIFFICGQSVLKTYSPVLFHNQTFLFQLNVSS